MTHKQSRIEGTYGQSAIDLKVFAPVDGKTDAGIRNFLASSLGASRPHVELVIQTPNPKDVLNSLLPDIRG